MNHSGTFSSTSPISLRQLQETYVRPHARLLGHLLLTTAVAVAILATSFNSVYAQSGNREYIVAPNSYENQAGGFLTIPAIHWVPTTVQQIYHESQLNGLVNHEIESITYRTHEVLPGGFPFVETTWLEYDIFIGRSLSPSSVTDEFAANFIETPTLVHSGPLTVPFMAFQPGQWGFEIEFDEPFLYTGGHLALLTRHSGTPANTNQGNRLLDSVDIDEPAYGTDISALFEFGQDATVGRLNFQAAITRFGGAPIPEPLSIIPVTIATLALLTYRWRRAR